MKKVCVFCASSPKVNPVFLKEAEDLAEQLVQSEYGIVYGGGAVGLMGRLADKTLQLKGEISGVIPHFMVEVEWEHTGVKNMIHVNDMAERKRLLVKDTSAIVVLAGGIGTLEELFEVLSLKKLGQLKQPIIIVNTDGYFNPLLQMLQVMIDESFMREEHGQMWSVVDRASDVCDVLASIPEWADNALDFAAVK